MTDAELVEKYTPLTWHIARRLVPAHDVDDAVQDAMVGIIAANRRYRTDWTYSHHRWISDAIRRSIIDGRRRRTNYNKYRRRARSAPLSLEHVVDNDRATIGDTLEAPHADLDLDLIADDLDRWVRTLFDDPADIVVLAGMLDGRPKQDLAAELGVTASRVSQRVTQIRATVAAAM